MKIVDRSANPYLATAAILGLALDGIQNGATLPLEVTVDPHTLTEAQRRAAGAVGLSTDQADTIAALDHSPRIRAIFGEAPVDALVAVRRFEQEHYRDLDAGALADKFRMAWSL